MARRRSRKRKRKTTKKRPLGRWLLIGAVACLASLVVGAFLVYIGLRGYLHSERFSGMVADQVSGLLKAEGEFDTFKWSGDTAYTGSFRAEGGEAALFSKLRAERIEGRVNFSAVRRGVWELANIDIGRVNVLLTGERKPGAVGGSPGEEPAGGEGETGGGGGLLSRFIPDRVELVRAAIGELNFDATFDGRRIAGRDAAVELRPTASPEVFRISARGGEITASGYPELEMEEIELRAGAEEAIVDHAEFKLYDEVSLSANGEVKMGGEKPALDLEVRVRNLPAEKVLSEDWAKKLTGTVEVDAVAAGWPGEGGGLSINGDLVLKNGVLEAVPALERADEMLGSSKFRRLAFSDFKVGFKRSGEDTELRDVYALSQGALCLKGRLSLPAEGDPSGVYMLGITQDTIKWLPLIKKAVLEGVFAHNRDDAFRQVFGNAPGIEKPPEGFRWAVAQVMPNEPDPYTADLRKQLSDVGGLAILAELAGASKEVVAALEVLGKEAQDQGVELLAVLGEGAGDGPLFSPSNIVRAAGELGVAGQVTKIFDDVVGGVGEAAGDVIGTGLEVLGGFFR